MTASAEAMMSAVRQVGEPRLRGVARGGHQIHDVLLHLLVDVHVANDPPRPQQRLRRDDLARLLRGRTRLPAEDLQLLVRLRIAHDDFEHEAIDLRLGKGIRPLLLDRVLRGHHQERLRERVGGLPDRHLPLLHRLQQGTLHLGRGAVDLVGENDVGKDRPLLDGERAVLRAIDLRPDQVRR